LRALSRAAARARSTIAAASSCMPGMTWVEIERNADLAVSQPLARYLGVDAVGKQMRGMGVPKVVKPEAGKSCRGNLPRP